MRKMAAALTLLVALTGCASIGNNMASWVGRSSNELILVWGAPTRENSDGAGGVVLTYEQYVPRQAVFVPGAGNIMMGGYTRTRQFYVRPDGTIYSWRWQGL